MADTKWTLLCAVLVVCGQLSEVLGHDGYSHEDESILVDPYHEIMHAFNVTSEDQFQVTKLKHIGEHFAEHFPCMGTENTIVINTDPYYVNFTGYINQATFEDFAIVLVGAALKANTTCNIVITATQAGALRVGLRQRLSETGNGVDVLMLQEVLESVTLKEVEDEHGHHTHSHDDHSHTDKLIKEECLGADVVFDQLGLDVDTTAADHQLGRIASLVFLRILENAHVSRGCRLLPRQDYFTEELFEHLGAVNDTLPEKAFHSLLETLNIGETHEHDEEEEEDDHDHAHRRRRRHAHDEEELHEFLHKHSWKDTCYSADNLLAMFGIFHGEDGVSMVMFKEMCPALIQQQVDKACEEHEEAKKETRRPTDAERYGYGTIAGIIVCLCAVPGICCIACSAGKVYDIIMALFLGLAVGTLYGDALLHLFPLALGVHAHHSAEEHLHDHEGEEMTVEPFIWYSSVACAGVYAFYLLEMFMHIFNPHGKSDQGHSHTALDGVGPPDVRPKKQREDSYEVNFADSETESKKSTKGIPTIAIMIIIGDGIHNFIDGLAMGAAFSASIPLGISTSIAIFCHELPHELGDFAVLVNSGMSNMKALLWNFISALTCMVGLYVALAASSNDDAIRWIVGFTAGMFLYISLTVMLPDMIKKEFTVLNFVLNNVGIVLGFGIMLVIAIFEEKIHV